MEEKAKQEDDYWQKLREDGRKAKKNESNVSYDILTLQYAQDAGGEIQKYQDDQGKVEDVDHDNDSDDDDVTAMSYGDSMNLLVLILM